MIYIPRSAVQYETKGTDYEIRSLNSTQIKTSYLWTLRSLADVNLDLESIKRIVSAITLNNGYIFVAIRNNEIIATATLLLERKIIHDGGIVGHVEDVAVRKDYQGVGIGQSIMNHLVEEAKLAGCYKVILDCSSELIGFYERVGFKQWSTAMRLDLE